MSAGAEASVQSSFDQDLAEVLRIKDAHKRASFNPVLDEHGAQAHYDIERLLEFIENLWRAYSVEANKQERLRATLSSIVPTVLREVGELPYDSPDDNPLLLQCTSSELETILRRALGEEP